MNNTFAFKDKSGSVVSVVSMDDIFSAAYTDGAENSYLELSYDGRKSVIITATNIVNMNDFFSKLHGDSPVDDVDDVDDVEFKSDCVSGCDQVGLLLKEVKTNYQYHVIFFRDVANTIVLNDINTLFVDHNTKNIHLTSRCGMLPKTYDFETYGNLFEKINRSLYYVIDDLIAIYLYDITYLKVERLDVCRYNITVKYVNCPTVNHIINVDDDRIIHLLNVINQL